MLVLAVIGVMAFGCAKNPDFVNPVFQCDCGTFTFDGVDYPLQMAEYVPANDTTDVGRRYFLTADIREGSESLPHNLSMQLEIDSVTTPIHYIPADGLFNLVEEVNENDNLLPYRTYVVTNGVINVTPAIFGGEETVSMECIIRETVAGDTVGFDIPFNSTFTVTIE